MAHYQGEPGALAWSNAVDADRAAYARQVAGVYYLNAYSAFFGALYNGVTTGMPFVTGQATTATTLTAQATAGTTTLSVTSAVGITANVLLVTGAGTPTQQIHRVVSVAGNDLTIASAVVTTIASASSVAPVWTNSTHLTADSVGGTRAFGYFTASALDSTGAYVIPTAGNIVWLGDSWAAQSVIGFTAAIQARLGGGVTVTNAGVSGNKLSDMIARFATDVTPLAPAYVVVEFGVNDIAGLVTLDTIAAQMEQIVALCRAIGARVIFTGIVPLMDWPVTAYEANGELNAWCDSSVLFPATTVAAVARRAADAYSSPYARTAYMAGHYYCSTAGVPGVYAAYAAGWTVIVPWVVATKRTFDRAAIEVTTAAAGSTVTLGLYAANFAGQFVNQPGHLLATSPALDTSTTGLKAATVSWTLLPGIYWIAVMVLGGGPLAMRSETSEHPLVTHGSAPANLSTSNCYLTTGNASLPAEWNGVSASSVAPRVALRAT